MRILMYDLEEGGLRTVRETILEVHECRGSHDHCEEPAICEDCGHEATQDRPVYVWTTADDFTFWACAECLVDDPFCDLSADPIE